MTMDLKKYRIIDLTMLTLLAVVAQVVGTYLHNVLPYAGFYLNFGVLIAIIAIYRWGGYGTFVLVISGIPLVFIGVNTMGVNLVLHVIAPAAIYGLAVLLRSVDAERILRDTLMLFLLTAVTYVILSLGQAVGVLLLGDNPINGGVMYFLANSFNMIMTYVVLLLVRKRPGLMIDMKTYFEREQNNHEYSS